MVATKKCCRCGKRKPLENFYKEPCHKDGRRSACKGCESARHARYRVKLKLAREQSASIKNLTMFTRECPLCGEIKENRHNPICNACASNLADTGKSYCKKCKQAHPKECFYDDFRATDNKQPICKACTSTRDKLNRIKWKKKAMRAVSGVKCEVCDITDHDMLIIHHRNRPGDASRGDTGTDYTFYRYILNHPKRTGNFRVLCRNHHAKLHANKRRAVLT